MRLRLLLTWPGLLGIWLCGAVLHASPSAVPGKVYVLKAVGSINPGLAGYIKEGIAQAEKDRVVALVIALDTPGGLDTSMREIVQAIVNAQVPVIVYVHPKGARAASAGVMITMAATVAAMTPGTNIGAAHPVAIGTQKMDKTMQEKVLNDMVAYGRSLAQDRGRNVDWVEKAVRQSVSIGAEEALKLKVVELVAADLPELLQKLDGRQVVVQKETRKLATAAAQVVELPISWRHRVLTQLADPNLAMILMVLGLAGLYFELAHPGAILPGVLGGICLLLAFYAFQTLPVNFIGLLLILLAFIFFILEVYVTSYGLLALAGIIAMALGGLMLYQQGAGGVSISLEVLITTLLVITLFFLAVAYLAVRSQLRRPLTGTAGLLGERGTALTDLNPGGKVLIHGEYWEARAETLIPAGTPVEVVEVDGLQLLVKPLGATTKGA